MEIPLLSLLLLLLLLSLPLSTLPLPPPPNDTTALLLFRSQTDTHGNLLSNWTLPTPSSTPCSASWQGVRCSPTKPTRIISLSLPYLDLRGPIDSLSSLDQLRLLDLHSNRLNGSLSSLALCTNLKLIYLSGNDFTDEIPPNISSLARLLRLDLSNNNLKGPLPNSISNLTRLLTLRLQNNELSGPIPQFLDSITSLKQLNLSNNEFYGNLPENLRRKFGDQSFYGNKGICGSSPLPVCSFTGKPPTDPASAQTVPSNPSSLPSTTVIPNRKPKRKGLSPEAIVAIVIPSFVVLLIISSFVVAFHCSSRNSRDSSYGSEIGKRRSSSSYATERKVYNGESDGTNATDRSRLVFFDGGRSKKFELEDLLKASAEMLGKGGFGTVYKAVLEDGYAVAVKRLKDSNPCGRKEFEQYMDVIGKLRHPNVVKLRAYYYAKEEKLLVYDYLPNGSLHSLLHGTQYYKFRSRILDVFAGNWGCCSSGLYSSHLSR